MTTRRGFFKQIAGVAAIATIAPKELLEPLEPIVEKESEWMFEDPVGIPFNEYLTTRYIPWQNQMTRMLTWLLGDSWLVVENGEKFSITVTVPTYVSPPLMSRLKQVIDSYRPMGVLMEYDQTNFDQIEFNGPSLTEIFELDSKLQKALPEPYD
jgi:hypothetical protein